MSNALMVQFVGFESKALGRKYTFTVRESSTEPREFTLTIANKAFNDHRIRFQDAPDVCSLKLRRELATNGNHPAGSHFDITDIDLEDYRSTHSPRKGRNTYDRKTMEDF